MMTDVSVTISSTLRDILIKCRTLQKLVKDNRTQTMVIYMVMRSHNSH